MYRIDDACTAVTTGGLTVGLHLMLYAALFLLPLIPAYIIFKNFPAPANIRGTFFGFTMKAGGAFAGYLSLFLFLILPKQSMVSSGGKYISSIQQPAWRITADVEFLDKTATEVDKNSYIRILSLDTSPELLEHKTEHITMWVPDKDGELPQLILTAGDYNAVVHLKQEITKLNTQSDSLVSKYDDVNKSIELKAIQMRQSTCKGCYGTAAPMDLPKVASFSVDVDNSEAHKRIRYRR
ncbi:hypothetical protein [Methylocystis hirsuta]|uniref:hypothetical protein n=1 Tax=Methylocystis hirsuta TaxID=369798 RepID=UPI0011CE43EA|nr:hypothetical protein [Methylocystis hirsuta]